MITEDELMGRWAELRRSGQRFGEDWCLFESEFVHLVFGRRLSNSVSKDALRRALYQEETKKIV